MARNMVGMTARATMKLAGATMAGATRATATTAATTTMVMTMLPKDNKDNEDSNSKNKDKATMPPTTTTERGVSVVNHDHGCLVTTHFYRIIICCFPPGREVYTLPCM